jgi:apolipoprotein N-acyltransferase
VKLRVLRPTREEAIAAILSAALFAVAFPPFRLVFPIFLCLVPAAVAVARAADEGAPWLSAARVGFWFGFVGYAANLYWIAVALSLFTKLAIAGYIASLIWLAPFAALWAIALFMARRLTRWPLAILLPLTWTAHELALNYLADLSFPWLPLGLGLSELPALIQIADLSGVRGISFWIAATAGLLADAYRLRLTRREVIARVAGAVVLAAGVWAYGAWRMRTTELRPVAPIGVVQPNIPEDEKLQASNRKRFVGILAAATRRLVAESDPALIVWPETALPGFLADHPEWRDSIAVLSSIERDPILFGVLDLEWLDPNATPPTYAYYNAALLADSVGRIGAQPPYRKKYLVPIVERVPFLNPAWFAGINYFGGFGRGLDPRPFTFAFGNAGVLICYESIFPQHSRAFRRAGTDLLLNITNDAWFGHSSAPWQHFAHLRLRAVENRVGIVRSANTGISGYVDPLGRVRGATGLFEPAERTYMAETTDVTTPYVRIGDWIGVLSLLATLGLVVADGRRVRRLRRAGTPVVSRGPLDDGTT